jgi:hypothetical protein
MNNKTGLYGKACFVLQKDFHTRKTLIKMETLFTIR